jgi:Zn finger protein HypA/HybF involved in hydrogenase expression
MKINCQNCGAGIDEYNIYCRFVTTPDTGGTAVAISIICPNCNQDQFGVMALEEMPRFDAEGNQLEDDHEKATA